MKNELGPAEPRYRALLQLLRTADSIWAASRHFFARWDLGPSQFNVLNLLHLNPDGLSQTELSRQLIMHRSNLTGLVDLLERRGLVERRAVQADRRAYRVVLTRPGSALLREILPEYYARAEELWAVVPAARLAGITADLQVVMEKAVQIVAELDQESFGGDHENQRTRSAAVRSKPRRSRRRAGPGT